MNPRQNYYLIKLLLYFTIVLLFTNCKKDEFSNFGPFKPISNIEDIIILGNNAKYVAYDIRQKQVIETYELPISYANERCFVSGHLLLTVQGGDRYNIDIETGSVSEHTIPYDGITYITCDNNRIVEATANGGYTTIRYEVVENRIVSTYNHPIPVFASSFSIEKNDTIYWFPNSFMKEEYNKYIISSYNDTILIGNEDILHNYYYRNNGYVSSVIQNEIGNYSNSKISLEKIINLFPLETVPFFDGDGKQDRTNETFTYKDKVLLFGLNGIYMVDNTGKTLFHWGNYFEERNTSLDYKYIYGRISKKIVNDKLYVFGQRYNSTEKTATLINCCVEIDLITGEDNWIEVWNGW